MGLTGAILGDIAGSRFEFDRTQFLKCKELFHKKCMFTDDTVMSLATANAIIHHIPFKRAYQELGRKYLYVGYGSMFFDWLLCDDPKPYNSLGNGSAMRVGFIGEMGDDLKLVLSFAELSASCSHNHPEGIKGAKAVSHAIFLARHGIPKDRICDVICSTYGYDIDQPLAETRMTSCFDVSCQGSIPLALRCFYESTDFESCIRNAVETRCDRDTIACISGSIAESYYKDIGMDAGSILSRYLTDDLFIIWHDAMEFIKDTYGSQSNSM